MNKKPFIILVFLIFLAAGLTVLLKNVGYLLLPTAEIGSTSSSQFAPTALDEGANLGKVAILPDAVPLDGIYPSEQDNALTQAERSYETYASFGVVIGDVPAYFKQLREYVLSINGQVLSLQTGIQGKYQSGYLTAKVPVAKFDEATQKVTEGVKSIESQQISSTDVTGRVSAIADQLADLKDQKALKELELAEAKTELTKGQIRLAIQKLERQITNLESQDTAQQERIEYATLSVSASSSKSAYSSSARPDLGEELSKAVSSVLDNLFIVAQFLVWVVVYSLVLVPISLIVIWVKKRIFKRKTK